MTSLRDSESSMVPISIPSLLTPQIFLSFTSLCFSLEQLWISSPKFLSSPINLIFLTGGSFSPQIWRTRGLGRKCGSPRPWVLPLPPQMVLLSDWLSSVMWSNSFSYNWLNFVTESPSSVIGPPL